MKIKLTKIRSIKNDTQNGALAEGHTSIGVLLNPSIEIGCNVTIDRCEVNGIKKNGILTTSEVVDIKGDVFYTKNSAWRFEKV